MTGPWPCPGILIFSWGIRYLFLIKNIVLKCDVHAENRQYLSILLNTFSTDQATECYSYPETPFLPSFTPSQQGSVSCLPLPAQAGLELYINDLIQPAHSCALILLAIVCTWQSAMLLHVVGKCLFFLLDHIFIWWILLIPFSHLRLVHIESFPVCMHAKSFQLCLTLRDRGL